MSLKYFYILFIFTTFINMNHTYAHDHNSHTHHESTIEIHEAHAFATTSQAKTGAAFMVIKNHSDNTDRLINAQSNIAEFTEIHQNYIDPDDDTMMMRKIENIEVTSHETVTLEPAGYHIMLINLKEPLNKGSSFPLTLTFEKAGEKTITVNITAAGSAQHTSHDHHGHH